MPRANVDAVRNGDRALVYDSRDFVNDRVTPCSLLMRPATVLARYGSKTDYGSGPVLYPDLVDVIFDHRPFEVSHGHFTEWIEPIPQPGHVASALSFEGDQNVSC